MQAVHFMHMHVSYVHIVKNRFKLRNVEMFAAWPTAYKSIYQWIITGYLITAQELTQEQFKIFKIYI